MADFCGRWRLKKRSEKTENARSKKKHRKGRGTSGREEAQPLSVFGKKLQKFVIFEFFTVIFA